MAAQAVPALAYVLIIRKALHVRRLAKKGAGR